MDIITSIALIGSIGLLIAKMYNVLSNGELYDKKLIFITFVIMLLCWLLFFTGFMYQANAMETITSGTDTWNISNNNYLELSFYFNVINFTVLVGFFLTLAELLFLFKEAVIKPRKRETLARR